MATKSIKKRVGFSQCILCGRDVAVFENQNGTLSTSCPPCGQYPSYRTTDEGYKLFTPKVKLDPGVQLKGPHGMGATATAAPAPAAVAETPPPPASAAKRDFWA